MLFNISSEDSMSDIQAAAAFLKERGFERIMYWVDWEGMFAIDGKTHSAFFFPAGMSLPEVEKKIIDNRRLFGLSETSH